MKDNPVSKFPRWELLGELVTKNPSHNDVVKLLLKNRGISTQKERERFINPPPPSEIDLKSVKIDTKQVNKTIKKLKEIKKRGKSIIIYGDYDADGICATAILWETLYGLGFNVLPYIPGRFDEGYGLNGTTLKKLKAKDSNLELVVTVDNGIVAFDAVKVAKKLGIEVIITDHHQKEKKLPAAYSIIHTNEVSGSAVAWLLAREIENKLEKGVDGSTKQNLELVAIGSVADQVPLIGMNRSFVKYGLDVLNNTKRVGLLAVFDKAGISVGEIGTYHIGYLIAPRINATGRLEHAIDSLRLLCTKANSKASHLANKINKVNHKRQRIVEEVVIHAREKANEKIWEGVIVLAHDSYHEGVIGLAASKIVDEFYRPAIVISKGVDLSKASARSIAGFNIIEAIKKLDNMLEAGGGHPMAAGFSIQTKKIGVFSKRIDKIAKPLLTDEILSKKLKIDSEIEFDLLDRKLNDRLKSFEPTGVGNSTPSFVTKYVQIMSARLVGRDNKHLKLRLEKKGEEFDAIAFGFGYAYKHLETASMVDVAYNLEMNYWNGENTLQLKIKDIKVSK